MDLHTASLDQASPQILSERIARELADAKVVVADPRWPLLNRWSSPISSKPSSLESPPVVKRADGPASRVVVQPDASHQTGVSDPLSLVSVKPDAIHQTGAPVSSSLVPVQPDAGVGASPPCLPFNSQERFSVSNLNEVHIDTLPPESDLNGQKELTFSTPLGAWSKPLPILSHTLQHGKEVQHSVEPLRSQWPPLSVGNCGNKGSSLAHESSKVAKDIGDLETQQASLKAQSKEYPWAARMNPSTRNLHRVTIPEYMEDGTPKVRIPSHVLLSGLDNQKEYVVGQFYRCLAPTGGQIQAVVSRIWGRKCRIFTRKLGDSTYLFHIPNESTRKWVLQRGLWHVDDCLMFVSPWSPADTISIPEITTVPVWLTLLNIPDQLYSILGIKWIASGIGEPLLTEKPWLDPTLMGKAKILVEVKLDKPFPKRVALIDNSDSITMVDVSYSWLPTSCSGCGQLGHKVSRCLVLNSKTASAPKIVDNTRDSSLLITDTGKAPIVALLPIIEEESSRQRNSSISAPSMTTPVCDQETNELISTPSIAVATQMEKGTSTNPRVNLSSNMTSPTTSINHYGLAKSNETFITNEVSPLAIQVDHTLRRSLSSATLGHNRFSSLDLSEDGAVTMDVDIEQDHADFLTPAGKRILRERPVKPSAKAKEMQWHGNRGRGNKGGRG